MPSLSRHISTGTFCSHIVKRHWRTFIVVFPDELEGFIKADGRHDELDAMLRLHWFRAKNRENVVEALAEESKEFLDRFVLEASGGEIPFESGQARNPFTFPQSLHEGLHFADGREVFAGQLAEVALESPTDFQACLSARASRVPQLPKFAPEQILDEIEDVHERSFFAVKVFELELDAVDVCSEHGVGVVKEHSADATENPDSGTETGQLHLVGKEVADWCREEESPRCDVEQDIPEVRVPSLDIKSQSTFRQIGRSRFAIFCVEPTGVRWV
jgi:hypothetical protein